VYPIRRAYCQKAITHVVLKLFKENYLLIVQFQELISVSPIEIRLIFTLWQCLCCVSWEISSLIGRRRYKFRRLTLSTWLNLQRCTSTWY